MSFYKCGFIQSLVLKSMRRNTLPSYQDILADELTKLRRYIIKLLVAKIKIPCIQSDHDLPYLIFKLCLICLIDYKYFSFIINLVLIKTTRSLSWKNIS